MPCIQIPKSKQGERYQFESYNLLEDDTQLLAPLGHS